MDLYQQRDIALLVNREPDTFSGAFQQLHGPSISSMGWRTRNAADAAGRPFDEAADDQLRVETEAQIERESTARFATGRLWDDGIINPRETRTVLAIALTAVHSAAVVGTATFGVVRH